MESTFLIEKWIFCIKTKVMLATVYKKRFDACLVKLGIQTVWREGAIELRCGDRKLFFVLAGEGFDFANWRGELFLPMDYVVRLPEVLAGMLLSQFQANEKIFARKCKVVKLDKKEGGVFLEANHLLGTATGAYCMGLLHGEDLVAVALFSKGRKMNRLLEDQRSFELIRFCTKPGITVTGGLTKLLKHFIDQKQAGDIMTYVDKQFSNGQSFIRAGFKLHSEKQPQVFMVNKNNFKRSNFDVAQFNPQTHYLTQNAGSLKLIYQTKA